MSDERLPYLDPAGDDTWLVRIGPASENHPPLGEVARRGDGTFVARLPGGTERLVPTQEAALQFVVRGFAGL